MKNKKIIGIICGVWALGIVLTLAFTSNSKKNEEKEIETSNEVREEVKIVEPKKEETKEYASINFLDTYNENAIYYEYVDTKYGKYFKISKLKDKTIENKINEKIKNKFYEFKNKGLSDIKSYIILNHGDILSIEFYSYKNFNNYYETMNISLETGEDIKFEDIFTNKNFINSVMTQALTEDLSFEINNPDNEISSQKKKEKLAALEETVMKYLNEIKNNNIKFELSNSGISVEFNDGQRVTIESYKYNKYFAYHTRFKSSKNIYEDESLGVKDLIYTNVYSDSEYIYSLKKLESNSYVDIALISNNLDSKIKNDLIKKYSIMSLIPDYKKYLNNNKFNYITIEGDIYSKERTGYFDTLEFKVNSCATSKDFFEKTIKKEMVEATLNNRDALLLFPTFADDKNITCKEEIITYIYDKNNKVINSLSELFKENYDYMSVIDSAVENNLRFNNQNMDDINYDEMKKDYQIKFNREGIIVNNKYIEDLNISYDEFDKTKFE